MLAVRGEQKTGWGGGGGSAPLASVDALVALRVALLVKALVAERAAVRLLGAVGLLVGGAGPAVAKPLATDLALERLLAGVGLGGA